MRQINTTPCLRKSSPERRNKDNYVLLMWVDLDVAADPVKPQNRGKKVYGSLLHCKAARAERT